MVKVSLNDVDLVVDKFGNPLNAAGRVGRYEVEMARQRAGGFHGLELYFADDRSTLVGGLRREDGSMFGGFVNRPHAPMPSRRSTL